MPQALTRAAIPTVFRPAMIGFHGKIPARGDFVGAGLPRGFAASWDRWMQRMLASSHALLGDEWLSAWLEGPVWRFALASGMCGPDAVLGLWMPSVDGVGRYYPLTLAAVTPDADPRRLILDGGGFLAAAENAGREALANDLSPDTLAARMAAAAAAPLVNPGVDVVRDQPVGALWWTEGGPRVAADAFTSDGLPDAAMFADMLSGRAAERS